MDEDAASAKCEFTHNLLLDVICYSDGLQAGLGGLSSWFLVVLLLVVKLVIAAEVPLFSLSSCSLLLGGTVPGHVGHLFARHLSLPVRERGEREQHMC